MIALQVTGLKETQGRMAGAAKDMPTLGERVMRRVSLFMHRRLVQKMSVPTISHPFWGKTSPPGNVLGVRSGNTRRRISPGGIVFKRGTTWETAVGSPDAHVLFMEEGGRQVGTSPKGFLRIPTRRAQTAAGVDRYFGTSAKNIPGSFLLKSKAGNLWIATKDKGQRPVLLYLLKKVVRKRGRHIFRDTKNETNKAAPGLAQPEVTAFVRKANG